MSCSAFERYMNVIKNVEKNLAYLFEKENCVPSNQNVWYEVVGVKFLRLLLINNSKLVYLHQTTWNTTIISIYFATNPI